MKKRENSEYSNHGVNGNDFNHVDQGHMFLEKKFRVLCECVCGHVQFKKLKWRHYAGNFIFESRVRDSVKLLI